MFGSQVIRFLVYVVGFYALVASVHQLIVTYFFDFQSWVANAVDSPSTATLIISIGLLIGLVVIGAAKFNKRKPLLIALAFSFAYQVSSAALNIIDTHGMGTPSVPALFLGLISATLWVYYKLEPKAMDSDFTGGIDADRSTDE